MNQAVLFRDSEGLRHILTPSYDISEVKKAGAPGVEPSGVQITSLPQMNKLSWKVPGVTFDRCAELVTQPQEPGKPFVLNIIALQEDAKGEATQRAALPLPPGDTHVNGAAGTFTHQPGDLSVA